MNEDLADMGGLSPIPRSRWERFLRRLFPRKHCFMPDVPWAVADVVTVTAVTRLSWIDRLRVLVTGILVFEARVVTENATGRNAANSECFVGRRHDWENTDE